MNGKAKALLLGFVLALTATVATPAVYAADDPTDALRYLPVQDAGRTKPFDSFARETLQLIYGSQSYKTTKDDQTETRPATQIIMTWMLVPQFWDTQKIVEITHRGLKESLRFDLDQRLFSPEEIFGNERLGLVIQELQSFRVTKDKLSPYFQAVQRLENQLGMYQALKSGKALRIVPPKPEAAAQAAAQMGEPERWLTVSELDGPMRDKFAMLTRSFIQALPQTAGKEARPQEAGGAALPLKEAVEAFKVAAKAENPALYPSEKDISIEVHYKAMHPFMIAWIIYLCAAILLGVAWQTDRKLFYRLGWTAAICAFLIHTYGFGLRVYLTGRPPVSNMYESVVWVSWGAVVFSAIFEFLNRRKFILLAGSVVGILCLVVADIAPSVLDKSLQPLEPVLRSNLWLTVHVLTITLSYSAFFLAWCLGNIGLVFIIRGDKPTVERVRVLSQSVYRAIQVGVVLLAAGTILGGVWADYSWGRFWGWDPKETWALIALLGYLAMLHGRLVGWVQNFGMMIWAIIAFNLVIMAWYGVNYVLGAGLHTYGFGAGGVQYVGAFVALDLIYVGYALYIYMNRHGAKPAQVG
jgi:cytochrome c-type biogenesis protein CcsB